MKLAPFTWRVGVDNCFGYVIAADGSSRELVETHLFHANYGVVVRLTDGARLRVPVDRGWLFEQLTAESACAIAGIPAPEVDGAAELERRIDPFHVERHRSALWCALIELIRSRSLPCGYSLRAQLDGRWDGHYRAASDEDPEAFAAAVNERVSNTPELDPITACLRELAADAGGRDRAAAAQLLRTGWTDALRALPDTLEAAAAALARHTPLTTPVSDHTTDDAAPQLALL
ncbi:hypothetical protein C8N24_0333 [Solirubrobacter pauli]|uniref:Uncharacterized protein n=1 Tax=Solirubrobacter pauli TaxID=166793 RepID=A0A660L681_9ACTN|nr:hypothetical protein [Solirubrobacter pauli]RKQ90528.1 hypothetical protein C8N24_0333 [Solirubrobacter pauli]